MLSAHMDTVEPGRNVRPSVEGDRIVSDGTTILGGDCKAGVSAILEAVESVLEDDTVHVPYEIVFTREEETGLFGARNLDMAMIRSNEAVVFDGEGPVSQITSSSPTYYSFDVEITGRAAHAGMEPEKGLSAIRIATDIINQLPQGRLDEESTFNVGLISGGSVRNSVPALTTFGGEFRSRNSETFDLLKMQLLTTLEQARERYREATIDEDLEVMFQMYNLDPEESIVRLATRVMGEMGMAPDIRPSGGGTDGNVFRLNGIANVVVGMSTNEMHTVNEYVVIPDLVNTAKFCRQVVTFGF